MDIGGPAALCSRLYLGALPDRERVVAAMNFDNLVAVLAVAVAVPLVLAALPRVPVPGPVLEIVAGIVLGPAVLDLVQPDQAVRLVSTIGLAFLLFLAGLEIDVRHFRGPRARLTGLALGLSALLALITGIVLHAAGVVESPLLVGIILIATSLGLVVPILDDAGVTGRPVGQFAIAGASLGEVGSVVCSPSSSPTARPPSAPSCCCCCCLPSWLSSSWPRRSASSAQGGSQAC